ncbi:hypothetical protein E0H22_17175 [Rhodopseudomonas boonkerdii]|uniref:hypothetical protein n=1 Tax=Rhodopseudomonas boonkerdii TaxID=475937 RepID=UPI001E577892|nr:hypothetical protein [Rhodopseudomonas boonkerdii]UGV27267.1 hypothetical protein E0H22_17175 [Rhodopseudomonas boonkerdii]
MRDIKQRLEKLRTDAEECILISRLATNPTKRQTFEALAAEYQTMARHLETIFASGEIPGDLGV